MNEETLQQKYTDIRVKMKKCANGSLEKRVLKEELSALLRAVESLFGRDVVINLTRKKHGKPANRKRFYKNS